MFDIFGKLVSAPFRVADAGLRVAGAVFEGITDEPICDGKTFMGEAADEIEKALKGED